MIVLVLGREDRLGEERGVSPSTRLAGASAASSRKHEKSNKWLILLVMMFSCRPGRVSSVSWGVRVYPAWAGRTRVAVAAAEAGVQTSPPRSRRCSCWPLPAGTTPRSARGRQAEFAAEQLLCELYSAALMTRLAPSLALSGASSRFPAALTTDSPASCEGASPRTGPAAALATPYAFSRSRNGSVQRTRLPLRVKDM